MAKFCNIMNNYETHFKTNEKGCVSYTTHGASCDSSGILNEDIGLVALDSHLVRDSLNSNAIENMYDMIYNNILNNVSLDEKATYLRYLVKLVFKSRDIKDGNGERMIFYRLLLKLNEKYPDLVCNCLDIITGGYDMKTWKLVNMGKPIGSFVDLNNLYLLCCENSSINNIKLKNEIMRYIRLTLIKDKTEEHPTLCAKWLPREKKHIDKKTGFCLTLAKQMASSDITKLSLLYKNYRKMYSDICNKLNIVETKMAENLWSEINIKDVPSKAFLKYLKAFKYENKDGSLRQPLKDDRMILRNKIFQEQRKALENPESSVINTATLMPHEIVSKVFDPNVSYSDLHSYNAIWNKYVCDFKSNFDNGILPPGIVLADVSLSMQGIPMNVCIALSIILSDLFEGPYKNKVITFETEPRWHDIKGELLTDKIRCLKSAPWGGSTNINAALKMILDVGRSNKLSNEEMPKVLYIFSDMQWDQADKTVTGFGNIKQMYSKYNYEMPTIVFWNLRHTDTFNNNSNQLNTKIMSGFSPNLFKQFMNGNFIETTPWTTLKDLLESDRYKCLDKKINDFC